MSCRQRKKSQTAQRSCSVLCASSSNALGVFATHYRMNAKRILCINNLFNTYVTRTVVPRMLNRADQTEISNILTNRDSGVLEKSKTTFTSHRSGSGRTKLRLPVRRRTCHVWQRSQAFFGGSVSRPTSLRTRQLTEEAAKLSASK